jgi:hypothetical protein
MARLLKLVWVGCLAVVLSLGLSSVVRADEGADAPVDRVLKVKEKLGLTDEQIGKLVSLRSAARTEAAPVVKQGLADLKTLYDQTVAGVGDEVLKPTLDSIDAERRALETMRNKYVDQARLILTPTQQSKLVLLNAGIKLAIIKKVNDKIKGK